MDIKETKIPDQLEKSAKYFSNTGYGDYLLSLLEEKKSM